MKHILKIELPYYKAIKAGLKTFEIRLNDRNYQTGDLVKFIVLPEGKEAPETYWITYISDYAQKPGYVVYSIQQFSPV